MVVCATASGRFSTLVEYTSVMNSQIKRKTTPIVESNADEREVLITASEIDF